MSLRTRIALAVLGALLLILAVAALAYALEPVGVLREQYPPAATLFAPPPEGTRAP